MTKIGDEKDVLFKTPYLDTFHAVNELNGNYNLKYVNNDRRVT